MKILKKTGLTFLMVMGTMLFNGQETKAQYQFGYLSYKKALQNLPEYAASQKALQTIKEKYDSEATYNENKFRKMFADFLDGQKNFPREIILKRQKELQVAMEQGLAFRKDAEGLLTKAENDMLAPLTQKLDSILNIIGQENGLIFILNTDNGDFPFIHNRAGKDLTEIVIARMKGQIIPLIEQVQEPVAQPQEAQPQVAAPEQQPQATPQP